MKRLLPKSEFSRNVLTLMTGTTFAQAIPVAISPILTRIYTPQDFGVFALFLSVTSIFAAVANGRYELAIMLPEEDEDALNIAALGLCIASSLSVALLVLVVLFNERFASLLGIADIAPWLYVAPFTVFFLGLFNVLNYYSSRQKNYKDIARANVIRSLVQASVQVGLGLLKVGAGGLISGQVLSSMAANLKLLKNTLAGRDIRQSITDDRIKNNAKTYIDFPRYSLWAVLANTLSLNMGNILISKFYLVVMLGQYSLVQRVMGMPAALLGNAVGQVFYQQASEEKRSKGTAIPVFRSTLKKLILISVPVFSVAYFLVEDVFAFVFGEPWREAGEFARILVPLFAIRFVVSPLSVMNQVNLNNKFGMYGNWVLLILTTSVITISGYNSISLHTMLVAMTIVNSVFYILFLAVTYKLSGNED